MAHVELAGTVPPNHGGNAGLSVLTVSVPAVLVARFAAWHSGVMDVPAIGEPAAGDDEGPVEAGAVDGRTDGPVDGVPEAWAVEGEAVEAGALDGDDGALDAGALDGEAGATDPVAADGAVEADAAGWLAGAPDAAEDAAAVGLATVDGGVGVDEPPRMLQPATKVIAAIKATAVSNRLRIKAPPRGSTLGSAHCDAPPQFRCRLVATTPSEIDRAQRFVRQSKPS